MAQVPVRIVVYEGKAKIVYLDDHDTYILHFKDELTAFDGKKRDVREGKGRLNCAITARIFEAMERNGIPTHYLEQIAPDEIRVRKLTMIPVEVVVRNVVAGSMARRLGLESGEPLAFPVVEYYLKSDPLGDPWLNEDHIAVFGYATPEEIQKMRAYGLKVNEFLKSAFGSRGITLVDFKIEVGRDSEGILRVGDEITPDSCRLWDSATGQVLDKDNFRKDLGDIIVAYTEVLNRLERAPEDHR
ncbi:MAG: phosphoribosylaminoimidazolesuccinocarboxamide synthase [bacterium JZ-2024 1]